MLAQEVTDAAPPSGMALPAAADLQDHLLVASHDLERLQRLLSDACDTLLVHFYAATGELDTLLEGASAQTGSHVRRLRAALEHVGGAITAMQFQDMASQLIAHTTQRLRNCADRLAAEAFGGDEDGAAVIEEAPQRPNPVTQDEMDAGSIELF